MSRIYMHQGAKEFDPELLREHQSRARDFEQHGGIKRECDLWASPFTMPEAYTWEDFRHSDIDGVDDAIKEWQGSHLQPISEDRRVFTKDLYDIRNITEGELFNKSNRSREKLLDRMGCVVDAATLKVWEKEYKQEVAIKSKWVEDADQIKQRAIDILAATHQEIRDNSMFFTVDQSKILHIHSMADIDPFLKRRHDDRYDTYDQIMFDQIAAAGYSGIELHNALNLRYVGYESTVFNLWDVDSIAIWNPDCVIQIDREIACIARLASDARFIADAYDNAMDPEYLSQWIAQNQGKVRDAISAGIISTQDIERVLLAERDIYKDIRSETTQMVANTIDNRVEWQKEQNAKPTLQLEDTIEADLAKYCYENGFKPILMKDVTIGRSRDEETFIVQSPSDFYIPAGVTLVATPYDMRNGKFVGYGDAESLSKISIARVDDFTQHDQETCVEVDNGWSVELGNEKVFLSTIDFSKEYQAIVQHQARTDPYFDHEQTQDEFHWPSCCHVDKAPERIIDPTEETYAMKVALASRCLEKGKIPIHREWSLRAFEQDDMGDRGTIRKSKMEPGMSLTCQGESLGIIQDIWTDKDEWGHSIYVFETDTAIISTDIDFTKEYDTLVQTIERSQDFDSQMIFSGNEMDELGEDIEMDCPIL